MSGTTTQQPGRLSGRVIYDDPTSPPCGSAHRLRLGGRDDDGEGDGAPPVRCHEELLSAFRNDVDSLGPTGPRDDGDDGGDDDDDDGTTRERRYYRTLAEWSCIVGYCEALLTHPDPSRRHSAFPLPLHRLRRLVDEEFVPLLDAARSRVVDAADVDAGGGGGDDGDESLHRRTVRAVSDAIWGRARSKSTSIRDEHHANGLYACLRGDVDGRSLDCFGAALLVVIGMNVLGFRGSTLTLSEDHAYESHPAGHPSSSSSDDDGDGDGETTTTTRRATCEVAVPGNTKASKAKRGREISRTFEEGGDGSTTITAETSWLYMAKNPVLCTTPRMVMAAMISNLNCDIDGGGRGGPGGGAVGGGGGGGAGGKPHVVSRPLYRMKRDMLWILHDCECGTTTTTFPFALMELGECEEHLSSRRGLEWVDASESSQCSGGGTLVLRNEKLFLDAIRISRTVYGDAQVYPYLYCGHYHRDAGRDGQEYRLVESLRLYAEAARVASTYRYDSRDCLQLMKHFTTVSSLISNDILLSPMRDDRMGGGGGGGRTKADDATRPWRRRDDAVAAATWLIGFFDYLMLWEERTQSAFVEVLDIRHKHSVGKLMRHFPVDVRLAAMAEIRSPEEPGEGPVVVTEDRLTYFRNPRSKRLAKDSLLDVALSKGKVVVRDLEMALPPTGEGRSCRHRKKARL